MNDDKKVTREEFVINVSEPAELPVIADTAYVSSSELCKLASDLFRGVFADFEGCLFDVSKGIPMISLLFNHGEYDEGATVACTRTEGAKIGCSVIDRNRNRDRLINNGDRYYLTDDGKDAIKRLLVNQAYAKGNPNWGSIVSEYVERNNMNYYGNQILPQYTKVDFIDLNRLCALLFGDRDVNGDQFEYEVRIATSINPQMSNFTGQNYIMTITRVSFKEVSKICEKLGFGVVGSQIIR